MEDKRAQYGEDEIITLEFDDGVTFDCGMMGTFELDGKEYIALEALDDSDDVYLYGYHRFRSARHPRGRIRPRRGRIRPSDGRADLRSQINMRPELFSQERLSKEEGSTKFVLPSFCMIRCSLCLWTKK